jgi:hypothetical protein
MPSQIISKVGLIERAILHRANITITPKDSSGQFLGPGHAGQIDIQVSAGQFVGPVEDMGDGTYGQIVEYESGEDPVVTVTVQDVTSEPFAVDQECRLCRLIKRLCGR